GSGMAVDRKAKILRRHGRAVIGDADQSKSAGRGDDVDAARASVNRVLDQLLDDACRPLDDLTGRDAIDEIWRQLSYGHSWPLPIRRRDTGGAGVFPLFPPARRPGRAPERARREKARHIKAD